jgi:hypothetical protein
MSTHHSIGRFVIGTTVAIATSIAATAGGGDQDQRGNAAQPDALSQDMVRELERFALRTQDGVQQYAQILRTPAPFAPQVPDPGGDPLSGPVVVDAPFMGEGRTTVSQTLSDGTRIEQSAVSKFYRDRAGRVRREQSILGLGANPAGTTQTVITIDPDPGDAFAFTLDPAQRTARRVPRVMVPAGLALSTPYLNAERVRTVSPTSPQPPAEPQPVARGRAAPDAPPPPPPPPGGRGAGRGGRGAPPSANTRSESLGTRQIEGLTATGQRTITTIPTGQIGNDRPIEIVDERWESPDLKLLVQSRFSDPRTGVVEYRLTNISRIDPAPDLFTVPADYTVNDPFAGGGGARTGGPGGRGGRGTR